jgi:hypothetical protein
VAVSIAALVGLVLGFDVDAVTARVAPHRSDRVIALYMASSGRRSSPPGAGSRSGLPSGASSPATSCRRAPCTSCTRSTCRCSPPPSSPEACCSGADDRGAMRWASPSTCSAPRTWSCSSSSAVSRPTPASRARRGSRPPRSSVHCCAQPPPPSSCAVSPASRPPS